MSVAEAAGCREQGEDEWRYRRDIGCPDGEALHQLLTNPDFSWEKPESSLEMKCLF